MKVVKRDGVVAQFDNNRIYLAIQKAANVASQTIENIEDLVSKITSKFEGKEQVTVEDIQSAVEHTLLVSKYKETAKKYIEYRHERDLARDQKTSWAKLGIDLVTGADTESQRENSNVPRNTVTTTVEMINRLYAKKFVSDFILPTKFKEAHDKGEIHIHDLHNNLTKIHNCFSIDTKFITDKGVKSFKDFSEGDTLYVPTHLGHYKKATVKSYGAQFLNKVTLIKGKSRKDIYVTPNHRWILKDGTEVTTLKVGDQLIKTPSLTKDIDVVDFCRGFGWGDGTTTNIGSFYLRLCKDKTNFSEIFRSAGFTVTYPPYLNGDASVYLKGYTKELPSEVNGIDIYSFCKGYAAADASKNLKNIQATGEASVNFIRDNFDCAGMFIGAEQDFTRNKTNFGERKDITVMFNISKGDSRLHWTVANIDPDVKKEQVWCLEVEDDHSFILQGGVVTGNCMLLDYPYMLEHGFQLGNKWIETPHTILTAMNVLVQMVQVESNLQYGGLTLGWIDEYLAKYVYGSFEKHFKTSFEDIYETGWGEDAGFTIHPEEVSLAQAYPKAFKSALRRTKEETYKACKLLSYQLNTLQIRGESSPFVTIGYGTATDWAGKLIQESILQERIDEFYKSGVQEFPKHLFAVRAGVNLNPDDSNYYLFKKAIEVASQTCYPDFIFPENQEYHTGGAAYYMGCRSLLSPWYDDNGKLTYLGRGNTGVVTINLPRIALESKGDENTFFTILKDRLELSKEIGIWRYNRLISLKAKEAPFTYIGGAFGMTLNPEDTVEKCFADGRGSVSIGYIGLHEVSLVLTGNEPYYSEESLKLQIKVMKFLEAFTDQAKQDTKLGFGIYSSPVESTTERFCNIDFKDFGSVKGVTDKGFYVNSYHVNTETKLSPFEKIDIESQLQLYAKGGHVAFAEMTNAKSNKEAYESIIRYAHDKKMMYFAINSAWDFCKTCHWTGEVETQEDHEFAYTCPNCGESSSDNLIITRRLCGYITSFNKRPPVAGRIKEIKSRVKHG